MSALLDEHVRDGHLGLYIPCNSHGLGVLQSRSEGTPVDGCDMINSQSHAQQDQCWANGPFAATGDVPEPIFIHVGAVVGHINIQTGMSTFTRKRPSAGKQQKIT